MIICNSSNIDIIQGVIGYGNAEGITDWRLENTSSGVFNILNSTSSTPNISIIDNGNVGIGTVPTPTSSKLEIIGDVNISGNYRKNNRDIISDTSNYVLSTSNILSTNLKEQWTTNNNMIYYNTSSVGIGTTNPISRLHLFDDTISETKLTIQNNFGLPPLITASMELIISELPNEIIVPGATSMAILNTNERYILFTYTTTTAGLTEQTQYTFTTTEALNCDILIVGGGGGGGANGGGGGGGSGYVYFSSISLSPKAYTVIVGAGGAGTYGGNENGYNSSFSANDSSISYTSLGGGQGGSRVSGWGYYSTQGGCGGGGGGLSSPYGDAQAGIQNSTYGYGIGLSSGSGYDNGYGSSGGGGGGAGSAGTNGANYNGGVGGDGIANTITGTSIIYCAGGGGGPSSWTGNTGKSGSNNQGSYGSGSYGGQEGQGAPSGKNGVVIIRYRKTIYVKKNYKIGNYNGDFIVKSSINGTDTDYIKITGTTGAISNPTGTTSWTTASDRRIKENIERASYDKCYESINKLELNRFNYINGFNTVNRDITQLGFIAQEVKEIFPKSVFENSYVNNNINISDLQSIDTTQINYTLYGAVKKLIEKVNNNVKRIKYLKNILNLDIDTTSTSNITSNLIMN